MPRQARIDAPGALQHIIIRGIEKKAIFRDDLDRNNFLQRLGTIPLETSTPCFAWALLPNHAHLLLRSGLTPIATLMRRLLTAYAQYFNRRHHRHGQLFQNRYKSILCEEEPYLLELVRYIHLNPLRAGLVKDLDGLGSYRYSGHAVLIGKEEHQWQVKDYLLALFGKTQEQARVQYVSYVALGANQGRRPELVGGGLRRSLGGWSALTDCRMGSPRIKGDERILGGGDFVEKVLREAEETLTEITHLKRQGLGWDGLMERVMVEFDITREDLTEGRKERRVVRSRSVLCYWAVRKLRMTVTEVALKLRITPSAVSRLVSRGQHFIQEGQLE